MAPSMSVVRMVARPRSNTITTNLLYLVRPFTIHSNSNYHRGSHSTNRVEYRATATITSERERARTVAAYYNQPAVEAAAKKVQTSCWKKSRRYTCCVTLITVFPSSISKPTCHKRRLQYGDLIICGISALLMVIRRKVATVINQILYFCHHSFHHLI